MEILDLGCGKRKQKGAIGIDISKDTDADVIHDLNVFPYPFTDNEFDYVYADNVIEHLDNVVKVLEELHRISKNGATIKIIVPFFRSHYAFINPTQEINKGSQWILMNCSKKKKRDIRLFTKV